MVVGRTRFDIRPPGAPLFLIWLKDSIPRPNEQEVLFQVKTFGIAVQQVPWFYNTVDNNHTRWIEDRIGMNHQS